MTAAGVRAQVHADAWGRLLGGPIRASGRPDLLRDGRRDEARLAYDEAVSRAPEGAERGYVERRPAEIERPAATVGLGGPDDSDPD